MEITHLIIPISVLFRMSVPDFIHMSVLHVRSGYSAPVVWNYNDDGDKEGLDYTPGKFETPDVSVSGMMMWLTAQKHKSLTGKKSGDCDI